MASRASNRKSTKGEYIETEIGNKISRRAKIEGTPHIVLAGRVVIQADVCLRGDLCRLPDKSADPAKESGRTSISIGKYTVVAPGTTVHPPSRVLRGGDPTYFPVKIGENTFIGQKCFIGAASIGSHVHIGNDSVIGNACIIKDQVHVLPGTVMAPGMVVPSHVVVGGRPARILADLPDAWAAGPALTEDGDFVPGGDLREYIRTIK